MPELSTTEPDGTVSSLMADVPHLVGPLVLIRSYSWLQRRTSLPGAPVGLKSCPLLDQKADKGGFWPAEVRPLMTQVEMAAESALMTQADIQASCGTANKNASPKMVMPKATAVIGNRICTAASRPLMPPVQVTNGCEIHSPNGAV